MSYRAPPPASRMFRMLAGSSLKYENQLSTARSRPIRPDATSSRTATHDGCWRYMNASISSTPASRAGVDHRLRLARRQRQRLLAQHVLAGPRRGDRPLGVEVVRQRDVDGVDVGVREQRLVGPVRPRDAQSAATSPARPGSRDAIPRTSLRGDRRRPGMTFPVAMFAVDRTPQRSRRCGFVHGRAPAGFPKRLHPPTSRGAAGHRRRLDRTRVGRVWHTFARKDHKPCESAASTSGSAAKPFTERT